MDAGETSPAVLEKAGEIDIPRWSVTSKIHTRKGDASDAAKDDAQAEPHNTAISLPTSGQDITQYLDSLVQAQGAVKGAPTIHFANDWASASEYKRKVTILPGLSLASDPTVQQVLIDREYWVQEMVKGISNLQNIKDKKGSVESKRFAAGKDDPRRLEAVCRAIFATLVDQITNGYRGYKNALLTLDDQQMSCLTRITNVVNALKEDKRVCRDVIDNDSRILDLVYAPLACARAKLEIAKNNEIKKAALVKKDSTLNQLQTSLSNDAAPAISAPAPPMGSSRSALVSSDRFLLTDVANTTSADDIPPSVGRSKPLSLAPDSASATPVPKPKRIRKSKSATPDPVATTPITPAPIPKRSRQSYIAPSSATLPLTSEETLKPDIYSAPVVVAPIPKMDTGSKLSDAPIIPVPSPRFSAAPATIPAIPRQVCVTPTKKTIDPHSSREKTPPPTSVSGALVFVPQASDSGSVAIGRKKRSHTDGKGQAPKTDQSSPSKRVKKAIKPNKSQSERAQVLGQLALGFTAQIRFS
ncbi:hypothetical protein K504DRAFT_538758 [Pleomassaria siparia CBS 279.74]|uniref:Uncharacterized protein n=1 Tax=Pleomassaria siparia CBS 279.74 TaxID=1314801 RepID=A0A6G1JTQ3_9PLEO|nr:hypothetical protein K504DRAFT_538758 [Pleomassaria siparia CBS 279.74]